MDKYNWERISYPLEKYDQKKVEKNNCSQCLLC